MQDNNSFGSYKNFKIPECLLKPKSKCKIASKSNTEIVDTKKVNTDNLWFNNSHETWLSLESNYWNLIKEPNKKLEHEMEDLDWHDIEQMETREFYDFLHEKYFVWKYTAANRLATTRKHLKKHRNDIDGLSIIQKEIFKFDKEDVRLGLTIVKRIHGLGYAGASGLLGVLFPKDFGVVDQYVCKKMVEFGALEPQKNPESLPLKTAVKMICLLRQKADELNKANNTNYWTPRKIDKVLWAYGR